MPTVSFHPAIDGFAFGNNYTYTKQEKQDILDTIRSQKEALLGIFAAATAGDVLLGLIGIPPGTADTVALAAFSTVFDDKIKSWIPDASGGWCGGLTFATMDYYATGWLIDRGFTVSNSAESLPTTPGAGGTLREYIWKRQLDQLKSNGALRSLEALFYLYVVNDKGGLLSKTKSEWNNIKKTIDSGSPCPIGIVNPSPNPGLNHCSICIGYEETDSNHITLHMFNVNNPSQAGDVSAGTSQMSLDFSGATLVASWEDPVVAPAHIFCCAYQPSTPPIAVGLEAGVGDVEKTFLKGEQVTLTYTIKNVGFGPSVSILPFIEALRPRQSSISTKPAPVRIPPRPPILSSDGTPVAPPPVLDPPPHLDVPRETLDLTQPGLSYSPILSAYRTDGSSNGAAGEATISIVTAAQPGYWEYRALVKVDSNDQTLLRTLPPLNDSANDATSTWLPFPPKTTGGASPSPAPGTQKPGPNPAPKPAPVPSPAPGKPLKPVG